MRGTGFIGGVLVILAAIGLSGCQAEVQSQTAMLYPEFTHGDVDIEPQEMTYTGELTPQILAQGLSEATGLIFKVQAGQLADGTLTIDWALDSTLFADSTERARQAEALFLDEESLRWFMLDSMEHTVRANMEVTSVYFTMDGGKPLTLDNLYPAVDFGEMPYMGSAFYFSLEDMISNPEEGESAAMDLLTGLLAHRLTEGMALVATGKEEIDGTSCYTFALGENSPEKFTALEHYAVSPDAKIYIMDLAGERGYVLLNTES